MCVCVCVCLSRRLWSHGQNVHDAGPPIYAGKREKNTQYQEIVVNGYKIQTQVLPHVNWMECSWLARAVCDMERECAREKELARESERERSELVCVCVWVCVCVCVCEREREWNHTCKTDRMYTHTHVCVCTHTHNHTHTPLQTWWKPMRGRKWRQTQRSACLV